MRLFLPQKITYSRKSNTNDNPALQSALICSQGVLKGFDQRVNVILDKSVERVFSTEQGVQMEPLGLYIIRGDSIVLVGEVDEVKDAELDLEEVMAAPIPEVVY